jgi:hypothetical protein
MPKSATDWRSRFVGTSEFQQSDRSEQTVAAEGVQPPLSRNVGSDKSGDDLTNGKNCTMATNIATLEAKGMKLGIEDRARLAEKLILSLDAPPKREAPLLTSGFRVRKEP